MKSLQFQQYCKNELFSMAVKQYEEDKKNDFPMRKFEAVQIYQVTDSRSCIISLYFDRYQYTGGAHGSTVRLSQTWQLKKCSLVKLDQLINCPPDNKTFILSRIKEQIHKEPDLYFQQYSKLIDETFNPDSFYSNPEGIVIYYQQYDIAPYSSGIRTFFIPYGTCVLDPKMMCS